MKPRTKIVLQIVAFVAGPVVLMLLPLFVGVWLPDVFVDRVYVLAEAKSSDGTQFRVEQFWNHGDFYTTNLLVTYPDGTVTSDTLDWDDAKRWSIPLVVDEKRRTVTIDLNGDWFVEKAWDDRSKTHTPRSQKPR